MIWFLILLCTFVGLSCQSQNFGKLREDFDFGDNLCSLQLKHFHDSLANNELWAREIRDSWGSFEVSGRFSGNVYDFGNFDQCVDFRYETFGYGEIVGQYCTVLIPHNVHGKTEVLARFMPPTRNTQVNLGIGICIPASCSPDQVKTAVDEIMWENLNVTSSPMFDPHTFCTTSQRPLESSNFLLISASVLFASLFLLLVISAFYDVSCEMRNSKKLPLLCAFSLYSNARTILSLKPSSSKDITYLHGIRSLAMLSIVFGHTYMVSFWMAPSMNSHALLDWMGNASSMIILVGFLGVDTFFMISSLLLTLSIFRELDKTNRINLLILYAKRYFRITIPLAAAVLFTLVFLFHISNGPLWTFTTKSVAIDLCNDWWWTTLLYVGNYVNPGKLCFGHSWYLMVDMQLYLVSPIVLYPLWRFRKHTKLMISIIFLIASSSVVFVFFTMLTQEFRVSSRSEINYLKDKVVYSVTHGRIDSWMMGILVGFIMHRAEGKTVKISKLAVTLGWTLSVLTFLAVTFSPYPLHQANFEENALLADAAYESLKRVLWCLAWSWVLLACRFSYGGIVKRFLSHPLWLPISRLSFCIYLIHVPVMLIFLSSIRAPQFFSNFRAIYKFFGDFGVSTVVAFAWSLMFEYPTLNIINLLMSRK